MSENLEGPEWVSIAEAARDQNVPARSLYRWARSRAVASKVESGVTLVRLADVRARAGQRSATANGAVVSRATDGTAAGAPVGDGNVAGNVARSLNPEAVARLFRLFDEGVALESIVQREQLLPNIVLDLHRQYEALLAAGGRPRLRDLVSALDEKLDRRLAERDGIFRGIEDELAFHVQRLSASEERTDTLTRTLGAAFQRIAALEATVNALVRYGLSRVD